MRKVEMATLGVLLVGIFIFGLGSLLYAMRLMEEHKVDWELQLAFLGFFIVLLSLMVTKIFSKVN